MTLGFKNKWHCHPLILLTRNLETSSYFTLSKLPKRSLNVVIYGATTLKLTPWKSVFLVKIILVQLIRKFSARYCLYYVYFNIISIVTRL
jgi:hypothetical protein